MHYLHNTDEWVISARGIRLAMILFPFVTLIFAAGGAWAAVTIKIGGKVDTKDFVQHAIENARDFRDLRVQDSIQAALSAEDRERLREIVCYRAPSPACR